MRLEAYWLLSGALAGPWARPGSLRFLILKVSFPEAFMPSPTLRNLGCKREPQGGTASGCSQVLQEFDWPHIRRVSAISGRQSTSGSGSSLHFSFFSLISIHDVL